MFSCDSEDDGVESSLGYFGSGGPNKNVYNYIII